MSTNEAKPTPGPGYHYAAWQSGAGGNGAVYDANHKAVASLVNRRNGPLLADALNVHTETGLTPRDLAEQREELRNACLAYLRHVNTTDGVACNRDVWRMMKAALAKTEPTREPDEPLPPPVTCPNCGRELDPFETGCDCDTP